MTKSDVDNRTKFLWIAAEFFVSRGYAGSSVDEIAAAAGTSAPALYRLFDSKQDLLDQLCLTGMEERMKGMRKVVRMGHGDPHATLRLLVKQRIEFAFGPWGYQAPITLAEYRHISPSVARKLDTAAEIGTSEWFRCLVVIRPDLSTPELLSIIYAVLMEITFVALHLDDLGPVHDVRSILEKIAMSGLCGKH